VSDVGTTGPACSLRTSLDPRHRRRSHRRGAWRFTRKIAAVKCKSVVRPQKVALKVRGSLWPPYFATLRWPAAACSSASCAAIGACRSQDWPGRAAWPFARPRGSAHAAVRCPRTSRTTVACARATQLGNSHRLVQFTHRAQDLAHENSDGDQAIGWSSSNPHDKWLQLTTADPSRQSEHLVLPATGVA